MRFPPRSASTLALAAIIAACSATAARGASDRPKIAGLTRRCAKKVAALRAYTRKLTRPPRIDILLSRPLRPRLITRKRAPYAARTALILEVNARDLLLSGSLVATSTDARRQPWLARLAKQLLIHANNRKVLGSGPIRHIYIAATRDAPWSSIVAAAHTVGKVGIPNVGFLFDTPDDRPRTPAGAAPPQTPLHATPSWRDAVKKCTSLPRAIRKAGGVGSGPARLRGFGRTLVTQLGRCACRPTLRSFELLARRIVGRRPTAVVWRVVAGKRGGGRVLRRRGSEQWHRSFRHVVAKALAGKVLRLVAR